MDNKEIYTFKLTSGQEVVAELKNEDDEFYHLGAALTLGQGPNGVGFMPVMTTCEAIVDVPLRKASVAMHAETRADIAEAYIKSTDPSDIITPEPKQIITG